MTPPKFTLPKEELHTLILDNTYPVKNKFLSRCVDGRYPNDPDLPALAMPGGDAGQLGVIYAAANQYGFKVDEQKTLYTLMDIIGGRDKFSFHSDVHNSKGALGAGCGHLKQVQTDPEAYYLDKDMVETILKTQVPCAVDYGSKQVVLEGEHKEAAAVQIEGDYGIQPNFTLETSESGNRTVQIFVYHKSLVDERHKVLAKKLIEDKAVELYDELDDMYLAQVLSETAETHVFETLKRLAKGLPLYNLAFKSESDYQVTEMGII